MIFQILGLLVVGLIIGALARLLKPGKQTLSLVGTMILGVVGAIIGGLIGGLFNDSTNPFELNFLGFIFAVIAAVLLVGVAEAVLGKNKHSV
ncbi:GlsB/YeaQ/YmgE family stress response membrane protein [Nocardioides houyundeii]|uniref:GlsB/YeaQ/YmgE family stress response membrane protein n=1 Tax=Nocardioides houyundeii TaxID=2045452 RepID=UPI001F085168|nr:GlsB/YeaQ/YmgE family stress response membrane protein [Nocardioides houyundeii]